jgi:Tfp pilus assembly protein PilF
LRAEARSNIGVAHLEMGQPDRALEDFEEALRIDPSSTQTLRNAAIALVRLGRVDQAVDKLTQLLARDPEDQEMRSARERLLAGDTSRFE